MKKIIPAFIFLLTMLFIFLFSLKDFISAKDDDNFMKACETNSIRHSGETITFPLGRERHRYEVELSDGKTYFISEELYRKIITRGCGGNVSEDSNN